MDMKKNENTMTSTTPISQTHFPVLDPYRSGTLYFETEAGRQEYLDANKHAMAVTGSPASTADRIVHR